MKGNLLKPDVNTLRISHKIVQARRDCSKIIEPDAPAQPGQLEQVDQDHMQLSFEYV